MLIKHHDPEDGETRYLLQKRAPWVDQPNTWGTPGGGLHEHESPEEGASREFEEEMGAIPNDVRHHKTHTDDHGGWAYHTVIMKSPHRFTPEGGDDDETAGHGWFTKDEMHDLDLHPGFAKTLHKVASLHQGEPFRVVPKAGKWAVVDKDGKVRGEHASEGDAKVHQATLYRSLPEAGDRSGAHNPRGTADTPTEIVRARMGKAAEFHPHEDTACPSCASDDYTHVGALGICQSCGDTFNAAKSYQDNVSDRQFAQHLSDERDIKRRSDDEAFGLVTDNRTHPHPGSPATMTEHMHEQLRQERMRGGPLGLIPKGDKIRDRQQLLLQRSKPYTEPGGPMNKSHLSKRLPTLAEVTAAHKYPDPADHPFFKDNPVSADHIVDSFNRADPGRRAQGMRWYSDAHHLAKLMTPENPAKAAGVLAAYSPKAAWPDNMFNAARSLREGRALGLGEGALIMGQHQRTAQKIMDGAHHSTVMKSPKISDFAHLIEHGDDTPEDKERGHTRVVVDRHALSVATGRRMTTKDLEDAPLHSRHYYEHVAGAYRDAATRLSEQHGIQIAPHQVQAVTWGVQQEDNTKDDDERGASGKGRNTRTRNSWTRWTEDSKPHYPEAHESDPPNLHAKNPYTSSALPMVRADYRAVSDCLNCGTDMTQPRHMGDRPAHEGSPICDDCMGGEVLQEKEKPNSIYGDVADHGGGPETRRLFREVVDGQGRTFRPEDVMRQSYSSLPVVLAYGEVKAPTDVNTLRTESCPVCGETDSFDDDRCQVCHFVMPPAMFMDPDTSVAGQMDLKKDQFDQGAVGPDGQPLQGVDGIDPNDPNGGDGPMQQMPGTPEDGIADLFCPGCGFSADASAPMTNDDPAMPAEGQGLVEGDICPQCGQATMLSPNDVGMLGGEVPQEIAGDADADGVPDDQEADEDQDGVPDDAEPDVDADGVPDDAEPDDDGDGVPDDAEGEGPAAPGGAEGPEEQDESEESADDPVEDDEKAPKGRKDNSRRASKARF
jgi:8-oxo-dGTP pyrophosphatase MutT (NUDIX family)